MTRALPPTLEMIRELVAIPSVSSSKAELDMSNRAVVERLAGWLDDLGFTVEMRPLADRPDKLNLVGSLGSGPGGLVLAGHTDTVPFDAGRWHHDPFAGEVHDDCLYGLGSADMKAFLALAVAAASAYRDTALAEPLLILATADEESSMSGARALAEAGEPRARYAVVGEPTGLRPVRLHKGIMMERVHLTGRSGHSSDPALGRNALEGMHGVIGELLAARRAMQDKYRNESFRIPTPTLNLGHIHGGDNPNRICGECELHFDVRLLPGMHIDETRAMLRDAIGRGIGDRDLGLAFEPLFAGVPPMETAAQSEIVRAAEALTGHQAEAVNFGTEGPFYNDMGMETVILGPGHIDQAHQPDEYLALDQIEPTISLLRAFIERFCVDSAGRDADAARIQR